MKPATKKTSIRKRFTYALIVVVGSIFTIASVSLIVYNGRSLEKKLHSDLDNLVQLSVNGLASALWQYNDEYVEDYVTSLRQYQDFVFARVESDRKRITEIARPGLDRAAVAHFAASDDILVKHSDILHHGVVIGKIHLAVSRERIKALTVRNSLLAIFLLAMIVSAIAVTIVLVSGKYLFGPLARLEASAREISGDNLEVKIETTSEDEIGQLARTLDRMVKKLKATMASRDELDREVTERQRVEAILRNREELLNEMGSIAGIGGWEHDLFKHKATWTKEIYHILEMDPKPVSGLDEHLACCPAPDREALEKAYNHAVQTGEPFNLELKIRTARGRLLWVRTIGHPELENGQCVRMKGTFQDITAHRAMERQLQQARKMESVGNLAGGIAHDFNNILASIIGFTELALDDAASGSAQEDNLQEVYKAGTRARDLVRQILSFARQSDEERKPVQPGTIAKEVLKLIRSTIPTTIGIEDGITSRSLVMANPSQMHQLFMNLFTNAAQAMEDTGGVLAVRMADVSLNDAPKTSLGLKSGEYIKITVSDTGPGISPDVIDSIFEPYFTTKGVGEGTGMGLAMVHGIVESYGGAIAVDSQLGKGTMFAIYLPITGKQDPDFHYAEENLPSGSEHILFVDDEPPIAKMGHQILERLGYRVTACTSSVEALELFRAKPGDFDLVITDMTMPSLTGDELAMALIECRPDIPVVLSTGYSRKISEEKAAMMGVRALAYKPIVKADLARTVREVLDGK